jgi:ectoine hydroxylase-related dioxygenase (phytanoyl-CoA dioxygenase family)
MPSSDSFAVGEGVPAAAVSAFERDGVVCLRGVLNTAQIERMSNAADESARSPGPLGYKIGEPGQPGFFYYDFQMHQRISDFRWFVFESAVKDYAATLMQSQSVTLYYSNMFIKDSGCKAPTPWHEDATYSRMHGVTNVINFWVALDAIPAATALLFMQGSHRRKQPIFKAYHFEEGKQYDLPRIEADREPITDFASLGSLYPTVWWELEPGDALVFTQRTLHAAPGNLLPSRRRTANMLLLGDDAGYNTAEGDADPPFRDDTLQEGEHPAGEVFLRLR